MKSMWFFDSNANILRIREVIHVHNFSKKFSTIFFKDEYTTHTVPGQYLMMWLIGSDEIPLSVSHVGKDSLCGVTVKDVGDTTEFLCSIKEGSSLGIRGPFGVGYKIRGKRPLLAAGGIGIAGLRLLAYKMISKGIFPTIVIGTRTSSENVFHEEFEDLGKSGLLEYLPITDDGSLGQKGLASQIVKELISSQSFDQLYGCGPERMLYEIFQIAVQNKIQLQLSLERYMKCAIGICGQCALDSGLLVCKDGPVFSRSDLLKSSDFGRYIRAASGKKLLL